MELIYVKLLFISQFICLALSAPQQPEINDQFSTATEETPVENDEVLNTHTSVNPTITTEVSTSSVDTHKVNEINKPIQLRKYFDSYNKVKEVETKPSFVVTIYELLTKPLQKFISSPKVNYVLKNVGTCLVNGAMEIIAHYFPAPLMPLIATAAGMVIPFEPVVMLKQRMPVTSYRRAFRKAMNSFMNTFDGYKLDNDDDDPYMTRRFNRRFMNDISEEKKKNNK